MEEVLTVGQGILSLLVPPRPLLILPGAQDTLSHTQDTEAKLGVGVEVVVGAKDTQLSRLIAGSC